MSAAGMVYLVGAGPWDPGLLTLRGHEVLGRADVVLHDYLVNPALLAFARPDALIEGTSHRPGRLPQDAINARLVAWGQAGKVVVRLKGGDPFVFGRGGEEAEALAAAGVPFEVVPGVTAAIAGAAFAGIPVTDRRYGATLGLCAGHRQAGAEDDPVDWAALAGLSTAVIYMGASQLRAAAAALVAAGRAAATPVALVQWASRPDQRTVVSTLAEAADAAETAGLGAPLTIIVGEVVRLRERLGWFERKPLFGLKIVVTRAQGQQGPLASQLAELGAEILPLPSIDFVPAAPDPAVLGQLGGFDLVIFTSANGVDFFLDALWAAGRDPRAFGSARIACIGPATARRLAERGLRADVIPARYVAEGLLEVLLAEGVAGRRVLIPRARVAREILPETLRTAGADVVVLPVYDTVEPPADAATLARIRQGEADLVTLTASSTVTHFRARFSDAEWAHVCAHTRAACIGPVTAATARAAGLDVAVEAGVYTIPGLVEALARR